MCADVFSLGKTLSVFESKGIEYLHIDVMDGHFVPNYALGTDFCRSVRDRTSIPFDFHLMTEDPLGDVGRFEIKPGDIVSVHAESTPHVVLALDRIRALGAKPFIAFNPGTPLGVLEETVRHVEGVLVMTVNPGFAGQKLVPHTIDKISRVREKLKELHRGELPIEVDGNVSFENAAKMSEAGADIFVGGTSSVFRQDLTLIEAIDMLRKVI